MSGAPGTCRRSTGSARPDRGGRFAGHDAGLMSEEFRTERDHALGSNEDRSEPLVDDLHLLADHIAGVLRSWPDKPMTFFGHSMGATLAFETTRRLESAGTGPAALLVSARRSPTTTRTETVHLRDDMGVVDEIRRLGGTDAQLLDNDEIIEMILPATRNDYRAVETYRYRPGPPVRCPITALIGQDDPKVTAEEALDWQRHTTGAFDLRVFSGGHFYLGTNRREVLELLRCAAVG
jgi:surfactin synthase thioesterase subunit